MIVYGSQLSGKLSMLSRPSDIIFWL